MAVILLSLPRIRMNQNHFEKESAVLCNRSKGRLKNSTVGDFLHPTGFHSLIPDIAGIAVLQ